jgi:hypothetical protein
MLTLPMCCAACANAGYGVIAGREPAIQLRKKSMDARAIGERKRRRPSAMAALDESKPAKTPKNA